MNRAPKSRAKPNSHAHSCRASREDVDSSVAASLSPEKGTSLSGSR